jgi:hypothetical protein
MKLILLCATIAAVLAVPMEQEPSRQTTRPALHHVATGQQQSENTNYSSPQDPSDSYTPSEDGYPGGRDELDISYYNGVARIYRHDDDLAIPDYNPHDRFSELKLKHGHGDSHNDGSYRDDNFDVPERKTILRIDEENDIDLHYDGVDLVQMPTLIRQNGEHF